MEYYNNSGYCVDTWYKNCNGVDANNKRTSFLQGVGVCASWIVTAKLVCRSGYA